MKEQRMTEAADSGYNIDWKGIRQLFPRLTKCDEL